MDTVYVNFENKIKQDTVDGIFYNIIDRLVFDRSISNIILQFNNGMNSWSIRWDNITGLFVIRELHTASLLLIFDAHSHNYLSYIPKRYMEQFIDCLNHKFPYKG